MTQPRTFPANTDVVTSTGRCATTVDNSMVVRNSETGVLTATNLIRMADDDPYTPGGEWVWNTAELFALQVEVNVQ